AHPGDASDGAQAAEAHADPPGRQARCSCQRQGRGAAHYRRARRGGGARLRRGKCPRGGGREGECKAHDPWQPQKREWAARGRRGFVGRDESTLSWLAGRPYVPQGAMWEQAIAYWRTLKSDDGAEFDHEHVLDCSALEPQVTWGTDPSQVLGISGRVPDPANVE